LSILASSVDILHGPSSVTGQATHCPSGIEAHRDIIANVGSRDQISSNPGGTQALGLEL
jgi:hypothetical protein